MSGPDVTAENSPARPAQVAVGPVSGYVFGSEGEGTPCFVPADFVTLGADGTAWVDQVAYVQAGWSARNARWTDTTAASRHLLPDSTKPLRVLTPEISTQILRWRHLSTLSKPPFG